MKHTTIPFSISQHLPGIVLDYLSGNINLKPFYTILPTPGAIKEFYDQRSKLEMDREVLCDELRKQYHDIFSVTTSENNMVEAAISALGNDETCCVTTGHQLNIFTGPLYTIYKIATTIRLSQEAEKITGKKIIPVFWMASEDHDFEEIKSTWIFGKKVEWNAASGGAVGRLDPSAMSEVINLVKEIMGERFSSLDFFQQAYMNSKTLSEATRKIYHHIFGSYGLIIIDGDSAALKRLFVNELLLEVENFTSFKAVENTSRRLNELQYKSQVTPRELNLFYLSPGSRDRIIPGDNGGFSVLNKNIVFTKESLQDEIKQHPENFSPNVVMRPLYQEKILPNLAYIGGPGEISYWLQLKEMFRDFNVPFPLLVLRNSFMVIDKTNFLKMVKAGITVEDIFSDSEKLVSRIVEQSANGSLGLDDHSRKLVKLFDSVGGELVKIDKSLGAAAEAEKQKAVNSLVNLAEKARRAVKKQHDTQVTQVRTLKEKLFPEGIPQERHDNFIPFYSDPRFDFINDIISNTDPFSSDFNVLYDDSSINANER